jgi:predicted RNA-binding protein (virulence factor B family)
MIESGKYQTLRIERNSEFGLYLADDEGNEVLLPNRYVTDELQIGSQIEIFVYHDSEDRLVATTEKPLATVGQVANLKVVDKTVFGAFLDWGLPKDLFVPTRNQLTRMDLNKSYPVYIYIDSVTGRVTGTARLNTFIKNEQIDLKVGDKVDFLVTTTISRGFRGVVNNRYWGVIYENQLFKKISIGDRLEVYVSKITEDNRIDVTIQQQGFDEVKSASIKLLELLELGGGFLDLNDASQPEKIYVRTNMSKKVFKRSVGRLLKLGRIEQTENGIKLINKHSKQI